MRGVLLVWLVLLLLTPRAALAHDPFEVTTQARVRESSIELSVTMTRKAALELARATGVGEGNVGALGPRLFEVEIAGKPLTARASSVAQPDDKELVFHIAYDRPACGRLHIEAAHLNALGEGFTSALDLRQEAPPRALGAFVLTASDMARDVELEPLCAQLAPASPASPAPPSLGFFLRLGVEHILSGYDHLVFLGALLVAARSLRSTLLLVSAFTLSHSVTLALAALGWVTLPGLLVESAIALSILVVGLENLWLKAEPKHRTTMVLAFGLVHGLGFAGALRDAGLGNEHSLERLFAFNLGIEVGQIALALLAFPLLSRVRSGRFSSPTLTAVSVAIALFGAYLLADRALLS